MMVLRVRRALTDTLKGLLDDEKFDRVVAVGPAILMKFIVKMTEPFGVKLRET